MINVKKLDVIDAKDRCKCGLCDHQILKVTFNNGEDWYIRDYEFKAIVEALNFVRSYNLKYDRYCFKASGEQVNYNDLDLKEAEL